MRKPTELEILSEIGELLIREHKDVQTFLRTILTKANVLIGSDIGFIGLVEEEGEGHRWVVLRDKAKNIIGAESGNWDRYVGRLKIGGSSLAPHERSFVGYAAYTKQPRRSGNVRHEKYYLASNSQIRSELAVPILIDGEVLGVINLESKRSNFYRPGHQRILEIVARLIARPLDSLLTRFTSRRPLIRALDAINQALDAAPPWTSLEKTRALNVIARIAADALQSKSCTIWLLNAKGTALILSGAYGPHAEYVGQHRERRSDTIAWRAVNSRCLLKYGLDYARHKASGKFDVQVYGRKLVTPLIVTPLLTRGTAIGVLKVGLRRSARDNLQGYYSSVDEQLLNVLQGQIAAAIALKRGEEEALQHSRQLSDLLKIFAELDLRTVLAKVVEKVPELCHGIGCSVFLLDRSQQAFVLAASSELPSELVGNATYRLGEEVVGWVGLHAKPLILPDRRPVTLRKVHPHLRWTSTYHGPTAFRDLLRRPLLAVPVFQYGAARGVLEVSDRDEGVFSESDERLLNLVASYVSTAIAYCDRYEDRLRLLRKLPDLMVLARGLPKLDRSIEEFEQDILENAARSAAEVLHTDVVTLYRFDPGRGTFETPPIWRGDIRQPEFMTSPLHADDIPWRVIREGSRYWNDITRAAPPAMVPPRDGLPRRPRFWEREGIASAAWVHLEAADTTVGVMFLNYRHPQLFDEEKKELIKILGSQVAQSLEIARLYRKIHETASRDEAAHLAQELHDALKVHSIEAVNRTFLALDQLKADDHASLERTLWILHKATKYMVAESLALTGAVQMDVDESTLVDAMRRYVKDWSPSGLHVSIDGDREEQLPAALKRHLYRIFQTAFNNTAAHAAATNAKISLRFSPGSVTLQLQDDGVGFDPQSAILAKGHYGLQSIKSRVSRLQGRLSIDAQRGTGTTLTVVVPTSKLNRA